MANASTKLTSAQMAQLSAWSANMRACEGMKARLLATEAALNAAYNAVNGISTLFGLLATTDVVDDDNGLAGSAPMTVQNLMDRVTDIQTHATQWPSATYLPLWTQAAGPTNCLP